MGFYDQFEKYEHPFAAGLLLPEIEIEDRHYKRLGIAPDVSNYDFLVSLCKQGFEKKGVKDKENVADYRKRLKRELDLFKKLNFTDYLLLNWDILNYCHENDIMTGYGRGSAGSSLVLFLIGVTHIDPIKHGLIFERFASEVRANQFEVNGVTYMDGSLVLDVDNDLEYSRRQEVIEYIKEKYPDRTSQILTLNTLSGKLCIKECSKIVDEVSEDDANILSDLIPKHHGKVASLSDSVEESEQFKEWADAHLKTLGIAKRIESLNKNTGVHPSAIAICNGRIQDETPLQHTKEGNIVTSYDMNYVIDTMIKFDILGLRTLTVVKDTCDQLGIKISDIDINDPKIYDHFKELKTPHGIFQIEAEANYRVCCDVKPTNVDEVADVVALARPGAMTYVSDYLAVKNGERELEKRHPALDEILLPTKGIFIYQEQLMRVAHEVFGLSLQNAEQIRKACGKKKMKEMQKWKSKIYKQAEKLKLDESLADFYWDALEKSANYSFNLSHAECYSYLVALSTYLKFNHPKEFFLSLLRMTKSEPDPFEEIGKISQEVSSFGINLLPPDLAKSEMDFAVQGGDIRYGLNSIKGISSKSLESLKMFRDSDSPNKYNIFVSAKEAGLNIGILSALIQAGTLSGYKEKRPRLVLEAQAFNLLTDREKRNILALGEEYNYDLLSCINDIVEKGRVADDGRPIINEKRFKTFQRNYEKYKKIYAQNSKYEKFANWYFEKELLGYSSDTRLKEVMGEGFYDSTDIPDLSDYERAKFVGVVRYAKKGESRAGNSYIRFDIEDERGSYSALLCDNRRYRRCSEFLDSGKSVPKKKDIIVFTATKSGDTLFIEDLSPMKETIFMHLRDLKE